MPRPKGWKQNQQNKAAAATGTQPEERDIIRVGQLNGSKVILDQEDWKYCTDLLLRAGYRMKFEFEPLMHGTNTGDVIPKTKVATAS